jgi:hypothetical protein
MRNVVCSVPVQESADHAALSIGPCECGHETVRRCGQHNCGKLALVTMDAKSLIVQQGTR